MLWWFPTEEEGNAALCRSCKFYSVEGCNVFFLSGGAKVGFNCEYVAVVEGDSDIFSGEVNGWSDIGEPWHAEDEVELSQGGDRWRAG